MINRRFPGGAEGRTHVKPVSAKCRRPWVVTYDTVTPGPTPLGVNALVDPWRSQYKGQGIKIDCQ